MESWEEKARLNNLAPYALETLKSMFPDGFVYAGNAEQDWPVWQAAKGAVLVNCGAGLEARAKEAFAIEAVFP